MKTSFHQSDLWEQIIQVSKESKKKHIAVAYLGQGASKIIKMHKGDTLVVDMSLASVRGGRTDPKEVEKYIKAGVSVFSCANLHAKIYVFDKTAIVGSGNLSNNSLSLLVEAGIITCEKEAVSNALGFIKSIQVEPVTPEYVKLCKKNYRPSGFNGLKKKNLNVKGTPIYSRLWLEGTCDAEFTSEEHSFVAKESISAIKKISNKKRYELMPIGWNGKSKFTKYAKEGDQMIRIHNGKVIPASRIIRIGKKFTPKHKKTQRFFVYIEEEKNPKTIQLNKFALYAKKIGLEKINEESSLEISSPAIVQKILGLWS